ncbi:ogr/Delta-like zinc finger family protein [Pandoraea pnomenusa]|uniref:ogr/Delta-like zinc finger family protein n=1 Tax=Pandoraea pnomenusa TaxID=93220 RepID=UPI0021001845|nr:ogr/Delta-like zinc finger family protein [Pandoraea pnomenusa]
MQRQPRRPSARNPAFKCPHCGKPMQVRTSRMLSLMMKEIYFQCVNVPDCCFTSKGFLELAVTLTPSQNPNPLVYLPVGKTKILPQDHRQMDLLADSNAAQPTGT